MECPKKVSKDNKQIILEKSKELIKLMNELHPHYSLLVTATSAELLEGQCSIKTFEFVKD